MVSLLAEQEEHRRVVVNIQPRLRGGSGGDSAICIHVLFATQRGYAENAGVNLKVNDAWKNMVIMSLKKVKFYLDKIKVMFYSSTFDLGG